jgi:hypothetical protein
MTDNRKFAENAENRGRSEGKLGQNEASREEAADEKLEHMGDEQSQRTKQEKKKQNDQKRQS